MGTERVKSLIGSKRCGIIVLVVAALVVGYVIRGVPGGREPAGDGRDISQGSPKKQTVWTCSMHPQIRQPGPGKCPLCGMDLIPVKSEGIIGSTGERELVVSEAAAKLMEIETSVVERKFVTAEILMVGKVDYDETRVKHITAWVPGRIDRLYVDYTGVMVNKGDHMVYLYSPELLSAQAELLQAVKAVENFKAGSSELIRRSILATLEASRGKLRLLGLAKEQIEEIEKTGEVVDHITIYTPMGGVVIEKHRTEGTYVDTGTQIYTIADLTHLWVKLDAYESDMMWVRYGQEVEFVTEAYPGEVFRGEISFIDPVLNAKTRTIKLRVNVENPDGKLKPEMFVRAVVRAKVAQSGMAMDPEMAGKWICPMHPSVVKTEAGSCDICGMDLVTTESLGYVKVDMPKEAPLVIPASATLITGKRAIVYVQLPKTEKPTYEGREVVLGPRAGDYYLVRSGLAEGEIVVTNGNFKIDSALQIQAKPSMMSADSGEAATRHEHGESEGEHRHKIIEVPGEFRQQFWHVVEDYLALQRSLAADEVSSVSGLARQALKSLAAVDMSLLSGEAHSKWMQSNRRITETLENMEKEENIEDVRKLFKTFSDEVIVVVKQLRVFGPEPLYKLHCPMAFNNRGADWLQADKDTRNPYFGASMLKCGKVTEVIGSKKK
ncbi:MAG: efflux RND transporter periplasmic adaptor subunit [Planctomycetota bacterium]|jgi:Cu(I)/Ag(I) efflux system membrane fusion protein